MRKLKEKGFKTNKNELNLIKEFNLPFFGSLMG